MSQICLALSATAYAKISAELCSLLMLQRKGQKTMDFVEGLHSGWRYLVLLALAGNFLFFAYAYFSGATSPKQEKQVSMIFAVAVDIQITIGIVLFILHIIEYGFEGELLGHALPMLLVAPVAHAYTIYSRRDKSGNARRRQLVGALAPILALILILGGLAAIEAGLLES